MSAPARPPAATHAVRQAAEAGEHGVMLRLARTAAGLTLEQIGAAVGYSASTLSRLESGLRPVRSVVELRRLADAYGVPVEWLGLATPTECAIGSSLTSNPDGGGEKVHRRGFIAGVGLTLGTVAGVTISGAATAATAGATGTDTLEDVLFGRLTGEPLPGRQLAAQIAAARADFRATRYTRLARRLPHLLAQAVASRASAGIDEQATAAGRLAEAYGIATQLLIKLHDNGMACVTADRAVQAAAGGNDPLIFAESQRLAATVLRRIGRRDTGQTLVLDAAAQLRSATRLPDSAHQATYGQLLAVAAYTAAVRDDRGAALDLLAEAEAAARSTGTGDRFNTTEVAVYRISVARKLGDYGAAVDHARRVDPRGIVDLERRARYWEDAALALHGRGKPVPAFQMLRAAERDVPEEVRYRPWAQQLTRDLLTGGTHSGLSGLREFAARIGCGWPTEAT